MEGWLRCKVLPGMFDHERIVVIEEPPKGEITSLFVDETLVRADEEPRRGHPVSGRVKVHASPRGDRATVFLPVACAVHGRYISVPTEYFEEARP